NALPRLVRERARMQALRLLGVALEHEPVVLEGVHPLDRVQAALEREIAERRLLGVVALVEEDELRLELVEEAGAGDARTGGGLREVGEERLDLGVVRIERGPVQDPRSSREHVTPELALERQRLAAADLVQLNELVDSERREI